MENTNAISTQVPMQIKIPNTNKISSQGTWVQQYGKYT
jgi:hypothetical protein